MAGRRPLLSQGPVALTADGSRLWFGMSLPPGPGGAGRLGVQAYDLHRRRVSGEPVETYPCYVTAIFPGPGSQVAQLCAAGPIAVVAGDAVTAISAGPVTYGQHQGIYVGYGAGDPHGGHAGAFPLRSEANRVLVVGARGTLLTVDLASRRSEQTGALPFGDRVIPWRQAALSPDGARLYVGLGPDRGGNVGDPLAYFSTDSVHLFHLESGQEVAQWQLPKPVTALALTPDGGYLLGLATGDETLLILNAETGEVAREVANLGPDLWTVAVTE